MRYISALLLCSLLLGCGKGARESSRQRLERATARLAAADSPELRFLALGDAAKESFAAGRKEDAQRYAQELVTLLPDFRQHHLYPVAFHDANMILGRIAVKEGRIDEAKRYLIQASQTPGSPQLMNYGPNMSLAKDLLEKGERQVVLDYFEQCRKFWVNQDGLLDRWSKQVKEGKIPDFGANLTF
jgi:hypothetical protein